MRIIIIINKRCNNIFNKYLRKRRVQINVKKMKCREWKHNMTQVVKNVAKRAFAVVGVMMLAFAVLASGLNAALPAYASEGGNPESKYNATAKQVIEHGHTDVFYPIQHKGKFIMAVEKDGATFLKPENTTFRVLKNTYTEKSQLPDLAASYYYLDIAGKQKGNPLYPGWDTGYAASLVGAAHADDATADIAIQQITGPMNGRVLLWSTEGVGKNSKKVSFEENDLDDEPDVDGSRFMLPGVIHQHTAGHVHANWGFTQPGVYKLKVTATITNKETKQKITTEPAEYTFEVEDTYSGEVPSTTLTETLDLHRREDFINPNDDTVSHEASEKHKDTDEDDGGDMRIGNIRDSGPHPHYHSYEGFGGLDLKVVNRPKGARIEWRYVRADEGPDAYGTTLFADRLQLPAEPAMNKMKVYAHATEGATQIGKDTASATIAVEDHGADGHPVVKAIAPYKRYKPGDTLRARTILLNPHVATDGTTGEPVDDPTDPVTSIVKDYVWLIKKEGEREFKRIPGAVSSKLELKLDASMQGATIRPSLVLKNGELYRNSKFDEFCDYIIEMDDGAHNKHDAQHGGSSQESESEIDGNPGTKQRHKKRKKHHKRVNGASNFVNGIFASIAHNGFGNGFGNGSAGGFNGGLNNGFNTHGAFQFTPDFFKRSHKKLKRTKNQRNQRNQRNQHNNNAQHSTQQGSAVQSGSFTRTENTSGKSLRTMNRRGANNLHHSMSMQRNKHAKKLGQTVRNFADASSKSAAKSTANNNKQDRSAHEGEDHDGTYADDEDDADDADDAEENHSSTQWVAAAAGTASVGLCTITGACSVLMRPRMKLL